MPPPSLAQLGKEPLEPVRARFRQDCRIYDAVGRDSFAHSVTARAVHGHLVSYGQASGEYGAGSARSTSAPSPRSRPGCRGPTSPTSRTPRRRSPRSPGASSTPWSAGHVGVDVGEVERYSVLGEASTGVDRDARYPLRDLFEPLARPTAPSKPVGIESSRGRRATTAPRPTAPSAYGGHLDLVHSRARVKLRRCRRGIGARAGKAPRQQPMHLDHRASAANTSRNAIAHGREFPQREHCSSVPGSERGGGPACPSHARTDEAPPRCARTGANPSTTHQNIALGSFAPAPHRPAFTGQTLDLRLRQQAGQRLANTNKLDRATAIPLIG